MTVIVKNNETLHLDPLDQQRPGQQAQAVRAVGQCGVVVMGNDATQRNASANIEQGQHGVKNSTTPILEIDVDSFRAGGRQLLLEVRTAVVDVGIETQFINNVTTFFSAAGNTNDTATLDSGYLADYRTHRATGS